MTIAEHLQVHNCYESLLSLAMRYPYHFVCFQYINLSLLLIANLILLIVVASLAAYVFMLFISGVEILIGLSE